MSQKVRAGLVAHLDALLVDELLAAYDEAKRAFYEGGHRLSEVEGGRFCEAAYRLLQQATTSKYDALGRQLDVERLTRTLANLPAGSHPDSVRLHIPRTLRVVYDVRNNRDAAHLGDGIDPNLQDGTLVVSALDWVLAEFVRLYHGVSADEAHATIADLVTRKVPMIEDFDGYLKVLDPKLKASDHLLVLLYHRGAEGAALTELNRWAKPPMKKNLARTLAGLVDRALIHENRQERYFITAAGKRQAEASGLLKGL